VKLNRANKRFFIPQSPFTPLLVFQERDLCNSGQVASPSGAKLNLDPEHQAGGFPDEFLQVKTRDFHSSNRWLKHRPLMKVNLRAGANSWYEFGEAPYFMALAMRYVPLCNGLRST
jgi:hypothetical protein